MLPAWPAVTRTSCTHSTEPEWPSGIQCYAHHTDGHGFEPWPEPLTMFADMCVSMWIKKAWLPCWPLDSQQMLHQRWIWVSHRWESMQRGIHPGFETQCKHDQNSKQGYQWPPKKTYVLQNIFLKKDILSSRKKTQEMITIFLRRKIVVLCLLLSKVKADCKSLHAG